MNDKLDQEAFKELERFAAARARGATVKLSNMMVMGPASGVAGLVIDGQFFRNHGYIVKIIEPTVLRDWTAEDAKKHVGFAYRTSARIGIIGVLPDGKLATDDHVSYWRNWGPDQYATPIPGTDPTKWDWKPCKVEVQAETPKVDSVAIASIRNALAAMATCQDWRNLNRRIIMGRINDALLSLEQP